ncbi:MAG: ribonuclease P protein component [Chloroflexi bacterium RBG_16_50_11]|nr:MAG: ribonuclease P protein component [Chloroflexi bacterium RBG_16_50_11]
MKGERFLNQKSQFDAVYDEGKSLAAKEIVLKTLPNGIGLSRFGFVVSRRVGKAVVRNRVKRRLREIARQTPVKPGWDIIFIARVPAANADYVDLGKSVRKLLLRAGLIIGENEGNRPFTN